MNNEEYLRYAQQEIERQHHLAAAHRQNAYLGGLIGLAQLGAIQQQNTEAKRQVSQPEPNPVLLLLE